MNILIIEDEARIAQRLERMVSSIFGSQLTSLEVRHSISSAQQVIDQKKLDLVFLDLNLNGEDGFEVLMNITAEPFHTIVVSAYHDRALEAFEYGVLDFVPKPFDIERLRKACLRIQQRGEHHTRYLSCQKKGARTLINIDDIQYIKGAGVYSELVLSDSTHLHNKSLEKLSILLPDHFARIHKSYIANMRLAKSIQVEPGSRYHLILEGDTAIPISRSRYREIERDWF